MKSQETLKACPFCGCDSPVEGKLNPVKLKWRFIACLKCGARTRSSCDNTRVVAAWNRRAESPDLGPWIEAVKKELEPCYKEHERIEKWNTRDDGLPQGPCTCSNCRAYRALLSSPAAVKASVYKDVNTNSSTVDDKSVNADRLRNAVVEAARLDVYLRKKGLRVGDRLLRDSLAALDAEAK